MKELDYKEGFILFNKKKETTIWRSKQIKKNIMIFCKNDLYDKQIAFTKFNQKIQLQVGEIIKKIEQPKMHT